MGEAEVDLNENKGVSRIQSVEESKMIQQVAWLKHTKLYFPFKSASVKTLPSKSFKTKGPPTFGLPTPLLNSAIRLLSSRSFSRWKYTSIPAPVRTSSTAAFHENGPFEYRDFIWPIVGAFFLRGCGLVEKGHSCNVCLLHDCDGDGDARMNACERGLAFRIFMPLPLRLTVSWPPFDAAATDGISLPIENAILNEAVEIVRA